MPAYISGEHQILMPTPCSRWIVLATALFVGCMPTEDTTQTTSGVTQQSNEPNSAQSRLIQDILVSGIPSSIENSGAQIIIEARDEVTGHLAVFKTSALNGVFELDLATLTLPIQIEAFVDLNQSGRIERCPTPARSHQIILDQEHDLWLGQTRLSRRRMTPMKLYSDGRSVDRVQAPLLGPVKWYYQTQILTQRFPYWLT